MRLWFSCATFSPALNSIVPAGKLEQRTENSERKGVFMASTNRRDFLKQSSAAALGAAAVSGAWPDQAAGAGDESRPNIILIMADDMGWSDIGCYGGEIETPNLDRLAAGGMRFTQFYNEAKCAPTRASLLTGLYSHQAGCDGGPEVMRNCATIAEVLKTADYRTLMTGKWHAKQVPSDRGFDRYYGLADGCCNFFNPGMKREGEPQPAHKRFPRRWAIDGKEFQPFTPADPDFYTTDAFTDNALKYLDEYGEEEEPFFLYLAYTAPHYPLHALPEDIAKYRGKYLKGWDKLRRERHARQIEMGLVKAEWGLAPRDERVPPWKDVEDISKWDIKALERGDRGLTPESAVDRDMWDLKMAVYAAMIDRLDQNIGRVLKKIEALGKADNTLVLFLSDNGGCAELVHVTQDVPPGPVNSYRTVDPPWANASNTPFRKYKRWDHEGGISTPLIAYWPGVIEKGAITHQPGHIIDIMATCCELGKAAYPEEMNGQPVLPLEGKSLTPVFRGEAREGHKWLFWEFAGAKAVRKGKWKAVKFKENPWELYDMEADRTELHDLGREKPVLTAELVDAWHAWAKRCNVSA
jgi:arylsulfatase A-like enzyme